MKWATRPGVHVDRAACAWLIRRAVDPDAEFVYIADPSDLPADATPFDMPGVDLGHHGSDCSFETILNRYEIHDPVLTAIAELIHEADIEDDRYDAPLPRGSTSSSAASPSPSRMTPFSPPPPRSSTASTNTSNADSSSAATPPEPGQRFMSSFGCFRLVRCRPQSLVYPPGRQATAEKRTE